MPYRTGHVFRDPDPRTLVFARYTRPTLPPPPVAINWLNKVADWGMLGNDACGDCEVAACCHLGQAWTAYAGQEWVPTITDAVGVYERLGGYDPTQTQPDGSNPTDRGLTSLGMLNYWRRDGIAGHRILAYVLVDHTNHDELRQAISLFGGVLAGADMPLSAGQQTRRHQTWRPAGGAAGQPGSWGGHAFSVGAYGVHGLEAVTWGMRQRLTWAWLDMYVREAYAIVSQDWLDARGQSPTGVNLDGLLSDLSAVTQ